MVMMAMMVMMHDCRVWSSGDGDVDDGNDNDGNDDSDSLWVCGHDYHQFG